MLGQDREIFHRLLSFFRPDTFGDYFKYFGEEERLHLEKMSLYEVPLHLKLDKMHRMLHQIHYSWFLSALDKLPEGILVRALAVFSPEQHVGLSKLKLYVKPVEDKRDWLNQFFIEYFLKTLGYEATVPTCFIPQSKGLRFLRYTKNQLIHLIRHLGIIELASVTKKVIDKKTVNRIHGFLPVKHRKLFDEARRFNEPRSPSMGNFDQALESERSFSLFIEKRGIERFARACVLEHPTLIWHIAHHLDYARGHEFLQKSRKLSPTPYTPFFTKQIHEISDTLEAS